MEKGQESENYVGRVLSWERILNQECVWGLITPRILGGGGNNPNNPPYLRHCKDLIHYILEEWELKGEKGERGGRI